jgi:hypothetical protein
VPLGAVVYEDGLEGGLYAGDDPFVDVALALLFTGGLYVEVNEFLTIDDGDPELFRLGRIEQHAFHRFFSRALTRKRARSIRARIDEVLQKSVLVCITEW